MRKPLVRSYAHADSLRPFIPDADEPTEADDQNEPYLIYYEYLLSKANGELPQVISNSYGDNEQVSTPCTQHGLIIDLPDRPRKVRQTSLQSDWAEYPPWTDCHSLLW